MPAPKKKDLEGMVEIFGKGSRDACIGYGYNESIQHWHDWIDEAPIEDSMQYIGVNSKDRTILAKSIRNMLKGNK